MKPAAPVTRIRSSGSTIEAGLQRQSCFLWRCRQSPEEIHFTASKGNLGFNVFLDDHVHIVVTPAIPDSHWGLRDLWIRSRKAGRRSPWSTATCARTAPPLHRIGYERCSSALSKPADRCPAVENHAPLAPKSLIKSR